SPAHQPRKDRCQQGNKPGGGGKGPGNGQGYRNHEGPHTGAPISSLPSPARVGRSPINADGKPASPSVISRSIRLYNSDQFEQTFRLVRQGEQGGAGKYCSAKRAA